METPRANGPRRTRETPRGRLAQQNPGAAIRGWDDAHPADAHSSSWAGLLEAGDAYLRIGATSGSGEAPEAAAREAYFVALLRARQTDSLEGLLGAAGAFAGLGDRDVVEECLGLAALLAQEDGLRDRIRAILAQLAVRPPSGGGAAWAQCAKTVTG